MDQTTGSSNYPVAHNLMSALTTDSFWDWDYEIDESALPLLVFILRSKSRHMNKKLSDDPDAPYVDVYFRDSAALAIQRVLDRDWGFGLELPQQQRDPIIEQMQKELSDRVYTPARTESHTDVEVEGEKTWGEVAAERRIEAGQLYVLPLDQ